MLRKYFKTQLHGSGVDDATINAFLGQKLDNNINYLNKLQNDKK